ncbi:aspartate kinase [candidate division WOR-1 bacterium RIFOXYA12_FULL_43_27]|uniref:Aspartokinase n=1 Tax=candidate division WOR-1 bacterium RIFOXYC2_FULL_46_14 TaxID=1802587 RepID=A0A1F4U4Y2_UNCSA|nr:MAG: aspartate kinase [candidate division WOR-1 bacterium RIFOXYA12_FULL_43_27]OGC20966.1 MAG: aspartate kinase [candidate division WOR-1 bacterium RIFOXYB2_FULL_46_45]OGC32274.1 MAG: aspartate kinase [candidate division WOR-1 bacterium RIFOXYA2_FULL_46_56]OGC40028.1 MAG: aspartate kinase [candidate division WOR-1 bacterium RIFOXYC2_FULL_46_14]
MPTIVHKYGGTSVGTPEKIKNVAAKVKAVRDKGNNVVVIVSAMGHTTDELIDLMHKITTDPDPREYDMLVSTGEQVSAALLAMALQSINCPAVSLTGGQAGVETEDIYRKARIKNIKLDRVKKELKAGKVVVITGFQGIDSKGDIITIGRGGSDTSAVAIAAALKADVCDIYTDVDGVYTTDPRIVPEAKKIKSISYEEMLELASLGAQVLHPRSVECAMVYGIKIHLRSSTKDIEGTYIEEGKKMELKKAVRGVALDLEVAKVGILQVPDHPGTAAKLFKALADAKINVDMIIQSVHSVSAAADMAFTVNKTDAKKALEITQEIAKELKAEGAVSDTNVAKISIVGTGMISQPGVAARMFSSLSAAGINIEMISTSEIKISCVVKAAEGKKAVAVLHKEFELDK